MEVENDSVSINIVERLMAEYVGVKYAVDLFCGTTALHLATRFAEKDSMVRQSGIKVHCLAVGSFVLTSPLMAQ